MNSLCVRDCLGLYEWGDLAGVAAAVQHDNETKTLPQQDWKIRFNNKKKKERKKTSQGSLAQLLLLYERKTAPLAIITQLSLKQTPEMW